MSIRSDGKVAIVTGGAMGIGAATVMKLCDLGAPVAVMNRDSTRGVAWCGWAPAGPTGGMGLQARGIAVAEDN
jgi:NAD(P)-dependent dehydrogenase (short-subunit alcohol dehydrogenase family)